MPREGLYVVIQATTCRRSILSRLFQNPAHAVPREQCCDICNPKLFDQTRPSKPVRAARQKGIRKGAPNDDVRSALFVWRRNILKMHYSGHCFAANGILDDATCELLASVGPIESVEMLQQLLGSGWSRWAELGQRLFVYMKGLDIPSLPPRQKQPSSDPQPSSRPAASPVVATPVVAPSQMPPPGRTASNPRKRRNVVQGTPHDEAALPATRPRLDSSHPVSPQTPIPSSYHQYPAHILHPSPQPPLVPRPKPRPLYRGHETPSQPSPSTLPTSPGQPRLPFIVPMPTPPRYMPSYTPSSSSPLGPTASSPSLGQSPWLPGYRIPSPPLAPPAHYPELLELPDLPSTTLHSILSKSQYLSSPISPDSEHFLRSPRALLTILTLAGTRGRRERQQATHLSPISTFLIRTTHLLC
ncbi:hypothetical protein B0H14DRAFT_2744882, partial [Mycena olivaceomarginata]